MPHLLRKLLVRPRVGTDRLVFAVLLGIGEYREPAPASAAQVVDAKIHADLEQPGGKPTRAIKLVQPLMEPEVAVIVVVPDSTLLASPPSKIGRAHV